MNERVRTEIVYIDLVVTGSEAQSITGRWKLTDTAGKEDLRNLQIDTTFPAQKKKHTFDSPSDGEVKLKCVKQLHQNMDISMHNPNA